MKDVILNISKNKKKDDSNNDTELVLLSNIDATD